MTIKATFKRLSKFLLLNYENDICLTGTLLHSISLTGVKTIYERLRVVEKLSCFELPDFPSHLQYTVREKKAVILQQKSISTTVVLILSLL